MQASPLSNRAPSRELARKYPSLIVLALAVVLAAFALPSALVLPQASPAQTLEYAPVPPNSSSAPPGGNFAGLGLGSTGTLGSSGVGGIGLPPSQGANPSTKDCVGNPPRQTEDPLSPPCVAFFSGGNGGATAPGVSGSEIRVLFYFDGGQTYCCSNNGTVQPPSSTYVDLWQPPTGSEYEVTTQMRYWQAYFDNRYETYNRRVHFILYYTNGMTTVQQRRADAADNFARWHPFAELNYGKLGNGATYSYAMAAYGVMSFGGHDLRPESFYQHYPGLVWGFPAPVDTVARQYASFVCTKLAPYRVSFGGSSLVGQPRTYGFISTTDPNHPEIQQLQQEAKAELQQQCGITFAASDSYPEDGYAVSADVNPGYGAQNMADFQAHHVTTILWPGGYETQMTKAATNLSYFPEWVTAGDFVNDGNVAGDFQDQQQWVHNWVVSQQLEDNQGVAPYNNFDVDCVQAWNEASGGHESQLATADGDACSRYQDLRQLFTGLQVAGPHLTPQSVDEGYHAIPPKSGVTPQSPSCYYLAADYTCLKNAVAEYWSTTAGASGGQPGGCYLMADDATRFNVGQWPPGDALTMKRPGDPCNGVSGSAYEKF